MLCAWLMLGFNLRVHVGAMPGTRLMRVGAWSPRAGVLAWCLLTALVPNARAFSACEAYVWGVLVASPLLLGTCSCFEHAYRTSVLSAMHAGVRFSRTLVAGRMYGMPSIGCCRLAVGVLRVL